MRENKVRAAFVLAIILIVALVAVKFLFGILVFLLKWVIILGIAAAIVYFIYKAYKEFNSDKPRRNLK